MRNDWKKETKKNMKIISSIMSLYGRKNKHKQNIQLWFNNEHCFLFSWICKLIIPSQKQYLYLLLSYEKERTIENKNKK